MLDEDVLAELSASVEGDQSFVTQLIRTYLADGPAHVDAIEKALASGDAAALVRPAHTLKSSSATVGAQRLAAASRELEMAGRSESLETVSPDATDALRADWEATAHALDAWLASGDSA